MYRHVARQSTSKAARKKSRAVDTRARTVWRADRSPVRLVLPQQASARARRVDLAACSALTCNALQQTAASAARDASSAGAAGADEAAPKKAKTASATHYITDAQRAAMMAVFLKHTATRGESLPQAAHVNPNSVQQPLMSELTLATTHLSHIKLVYHYSDAFRAQYHRPLSTSLDDRRAELGKRLKLDEVLSAALELPPAIAPACAPLAVIVVGNEQALDREGLAALLRAAEVERELRVPVDRVTQLAPHVGVRTVRKDAQLVSMPNRRARAAPPEFDQPVRE